VGLELPLGLELPVRLALPVGAAAQYKTGRYNGGRNTHN
jgi:hypothetical protein